MDRHQPQVGTTADEYVKRRNGYNNVHEDVLAAIQAVLDGITCQRQTTTIASSLTVHLQGLWHRHAEWHGERPGCSNGYDYIWELQLTHISCQIPNEST